jgi:hypothetical protein
MSAAEVIAELDRFEDLCRARGALNVEKLRKGITPEGIRTLEEKYRLTLPEDAKAVWLWHDGVVDQDELLTVRFWGHHFYFLDLEASILDARTRLDIRNGGDVDSRHGSTWVTLGRATDATVIDVTDPNVRDSLVLYSDAASAIEDYPVLTLTERIAMWNWAIQHGMWYLDDNRQWRRRDDVAMSWPERALL